MGAQAGAIPATGSTTISGLGGRPRLILFLGTNSTLYETVATVTQAGGFIGFACEDTDEEIHNYCEFAILGLGQKCSNLTQTCARTQSLAGTSSANVLYEGSVTEITDTSFTITFATGSGSHQVHYLAIWDIQPAYVFPYEANCDGTPFTVNTGLPPAFFVSLSQWRNTCHTFPKSTSTTLWNGAGFGDISSTGGMGSISAQSTVAGQFSSYVDGPGGSTTTLGATADPFFFGSICTGVAQIGPTGATSVRVSVNGCGGGVDFIFAQFSECMIGDAVRVSLGAGAIDSETAVTFPRVDAPEAIIFCNFQTTTNGGGLNAAKRWGFGFATPDYQAGFAIDQADSSFYQSESNPWIAITNAAAVSAGEVTFTPSSGDIGLVVKENGGGNGAVGVMGIKTSCPEGNPLLVSFSGFFENRPSGSQITTRGGVFVEGEGVPITIES